MPPCVGHDGVQRAHESEDRREALGERRRVGKRPRLGARCALRDLEDARDDPVGPVVAHDRPQVGRHRAEIGLRLLDWEPSLRDPKALFVDPHPHVVLAQ